MPGPRAPVHIEGFPVSCWEAWWSGGQACETAAEAATPRSAHLDPATVRRF
jgi:hypothetical protein